MATTIGKARCATCDKEKGTLRCKGCLQTFCYNHVLDHRQELNKELDAVEVIRDLIQQTLTEQTTDLQNHPLVKQIDEWEHHALKKIQETADELRRILLENIPRHVIKIDDKLNKLTDQIRESRQENDFVETDLNQWKEQLTRLKEELIKTSNIKIKQHPTPLVTNISVDVYTSLCIPNISVNAEWSKNGVIVVGGNKSGSGINQLNQPMGLYVDNDQSIYVADFGNHRIVEWKSGAASGKVVAGGNGSGNRNDQLNSPRDVIVDEESDCLIICDSDNKRVLRWPRQNAISGETLISDTDCWGLAMDNDRYLYVSDYNKHEVRRWTRGDTNGVVVAGGKGAGNRLDQLSNPTYILVDQDYSVYVSDTSNHRVMKWMKGANEGIIVAGSRGRGNGVTQLGNPRGLAMDQLGTVYVADCMNRRIIRWVKGATHGTIVNSDPSTPVSDEQNKSAHLTPMAAISKQIKRSGSLISIEQEHDQLLKSMIDNRTRLTELLNSSNIQ